MRIRTVIFQLRSSSPFRLILAVFSHAKEVHRRRSRMIEHPSFNKTVTASDEQFTPSEPMPSVSSPVPAVHPSEHAKSSSLEQWSAIQWQQISRRHLLTLIKAGGGVVASAALLAACGGSDSTTSGSTSTVSQGAEAPTVSSAAQATVPASQAATQGGNILEDAKSLAVNSAQTFSIANQKNPGVLIHLPSQQFVAFDSTCTHQQCAVAYNPSSKMLECPCHGAVFDPAKDGAVVQGPAQTPLTAIKITVDMNGAIKRL
jgi:thiosulfate dehydrogenase [quinone] large subunit